MDLSNDWRITNRGGVARARYLLTSGLWSDCQFLVGAPSKQELVLAHKLYLASLSPVFEAMFFGSIPVENRPIEVPDIKAETFRAMLEFVYTDELLSHHMDLALDICYCAQKYMLPDLDEKCTKYLLSNMTAENVCDIYRHAKLFEKAELVTKCLRLMSLQTKKVLTGTSWADADRSTVSVLFGERYLAIDSELDLYEALLVWCKAECARKSLPADKKSMRSVAGDLLGEIRFLALTLKEFTNEPAKGQILEQDEIVAIFMNKFSDDSSTSIPKGFSVQRTQRKLNLEQIFLCPTSMGRQGKNRQTSDETSDVCYCYRHSEDTYRCNKKLSIECYSSFQVDAAIEILGLLVPTKWGDSWSTYSENLTAVLSDGVVDGEIYAEATYSGASPYNKILVMQFDRPILAEPHRDYRIKVTFRPEGQYAVGRLAKSVTCEQVSFVFNPQEDHFDYREEAIRGIVFRKV